jgi:tetratricopeptide (TPR) repeat protein
LSTQALEAAERGGDAEVRARALVVRARAREAAGANDAALADLTQGLAAARAVGDRRLEMLALRYLGGDFAAMRGLAVATSCAETGLRIAMSLGDRASEADLLARLAIIAGFRLRLDEALEYGRRAVAAGRAAADERALAAGLDALKIACLHVGDAQGLAAVLAELKPLLRRLDDLGRLQWAEFETAFVFIASADWDQAKAAMQTAMEVNRRSGGYLSYAAWYTTHLGWLARLRGRDHEALALGRQALDLVERHEHLWGEATACAKLGTTLLLAGDRTGAIELFQRGLAAAEVGGGEANLLRCAAPLAEATGSPTVLADADRLLQQASIPADGAWVFGEDAYLSLARAWLGRGDPERARAVLAPLVSVAERVPWIPTLAGTLAVDGLALLRLGQDQQAGAQLRRAENLARQHGLPHVLREARTS